MGRTGRAGARSSRPSWDLTARRRQRGASIPTEEPVARVHARPEPVGKLSIGFLESVLNASQDCIKVLTLDGDLVFMNSGGQRIMEVDDFDAIQGCPWPSFWEGEHNGAALEALACAKAGTTAHFTGPAKTLKGATRWWDVTVSPILDDAGELTHVMSISRDITAAHDAEQRRELLSGELVHRVKNVLAVVGAIANQSFKGGDPGQLDAFGGRLAALGEAQTMLIENVLSSASVREVVTKAVAPHSPDGRCTIVGPAHQLDARRVLALSLATHELCTNATKYGAFSNEVGEVRIDWRVEAGELRWTWTELGGPVVAPPIHAGFGARIITRNLAGEFRGEVDLQHSASGVVLTLTAPA